MRGRCGSPHTLTHEPRKLKKSHANANRGTTHEETAENLARSHAPPQIDRFCSFFVLFAVVYITLCCDERMSSVCVCVGARNVTREGLVRACRSLAKKSLNLAVFLHERVARRSTLLLLFSVQNFQTREKRNTHEHAQTIASLGERIFRRKKNDIVFTSNKTFRGASRRSNPYSIVDAAYAHVIPSSRRRQRW